jgi:hypothetical protein
MRHGLNTDTQSHLRRYQAALPDRLPDSVAWLPPCGMELLRAYLGVAEQNRKLYRWLNRGWWVMVIETGLLAGIALAWILNRL